MNKLKLADWVVYKSGWGHDAPCLVKIVNMDITEEPREKYGTEVEEADIDLVRENRVLFCFSNGHWGYSDQVCIEDTIKANELKDAPVKDLPLYVGTIFETIAEERLRRKYE